jgi:SET domain-containing protein
MLGEHVGTRKVFVKRFDNLGMFEGGRWREIIAWCQLHLYHGGHYEPRWSVNYPNFYFTDEKEYTLFCLRWA